MKDDIFAWNLRSRMNYTIHYLWKKLGGRVKIRIMFNGLDKDECEVDTSF